jgi:hypothetical protein
MIHYHGTPIGGSGADAAQFLCGRHALVPFSYPAHLHLVKECCSSFVLDNGAFTFWRKGEGDVDYDRYVEWCYQSSRHPGFDWAIIPDKIDGTSEQNDELLCRWPSDIRGVPVYHLHEPVERAAELSNRYETVAIGSSGQWPKPGLPSWWKRISEVMAAMCDAEGIPNCRLHGLRMLDPAVFSHLPLSSADSTNCAQNNSRNGKAIDPKFTASQGAILTAWRIERHNSSETWTHKPKQRSSLPLFDLSCGTGDIAD